MQKESYTCDQEFTGMPRMLRRRVGTLRGLVIFVFALAATVHAAPRAVAARAGLAAQPEPAAAGGHSVVLTWTPSPDGGAYSIYRTTTRGSYTDPPIATGVAANCTGASCTYTDTSVSPGTYYYTATTVVNGAESARSNEATARILPSPPSGLAAAGQ